MKLTAAMVVLAATALPGCVHAVPKPTSTLAPLTTYISIVNYNKKAADDIVSHYNEAVYDNNALARNQHPLQTRCVDRCPPVLRRYCREPVSSPDLQEQDDMRQRGLQDPLHLYLYGFASAPDRSLFFSNRTTCDLGGFKTDFAFYESGQKGPNKPDITSLHESSYRSRYRLSTSKEIAFLKKNLAKHEAVAMKLRVSSTPDVATRRCVRNMILAWNGLAINPSVPNILTGKTLSGFVASAARDKCSHLVSKSAIRISRVSVKGFGSLEIAVGSKVYAAISLEGNINVAIVHFQAALQESARTARPVPIAADKKQSDFAVALIAGTIVTMGGRQVYNHPI
ncbi:hypothetical protein BGX29_004948 [Mortierella sp. GBA35]|nr:hypothetical protein BGX29_004948 [Mortierella sp. GBA35]